VFLAGLLGPYLSSIFTSLSGAFPLFGIVAYGIFAFYILVASVKAPISQKSSILVTLHRAHTRTLLKSPLYSPSTFWSHQ
jgi:hypothetical protein